MKGVVEQKASHRERLRRRRAVCGVGTPLRCAPASPSSRLLASGPAALATPPHTLFQQPAGRAAALLLVLFLGASAAGADSATILWRGQSHPVTTAGADFQIAESARALGFEVATDSTTGVMTLTESGHKVVVGAGTSQVPVDARILSISRPARVVGGALYAPPDFLEKVLFPLVGATGTYDSARKTWTLSEGTAPLTLDVAVVHVEPTTQIVIRQSAAARFVPALTETGFQITWPNQKVVAPYAERRYDDPLISVVRFAGNAASIEFKEKGSTARAYPLTSPDRLVVEIGRPAAARAVEPVAVPAPAAAPTIVIDPGHGGSETGAVGPSGLEEKEVTLQIARRLAAAVQRLFPCRVVLTRDSDSVISLDDRTAVANHEKADLFLSIHANSSRASGARGSETYYLSLEASDKLSQEIASRENQPAVSGGPGSAPAPARNPDLDFILWDLAQTAHLKESSELAEAAQEELNVLSGTENRGIKQAPFRVLVGATMPAVLVETAFISNPEEEKKLASPAFQQSVADAVARAIGRFFERRKAGGAAKTPPATAPAPTPAPTRVP